MFFGVESSFRCFVVNLRRETKQNVFVKVIKSEQCNIHDRNRNRIEIIEIEVFLLEMS